MPTYDYMQNGAYFVTICSYARECVFGEIEDGAVILSPIGQIVDDEWQRTPLLRPTIILDDYVIMPNHLHGILLFYDPAGGETHDRTHSELGVHNGSRSGSLGAVIGAIKAATTRRVNDTYRISGAPLWQRNYYEHVIRSGAETERVRSYIRDNPSRWLEDSEYVAR